MKRKHTLWKIFQISFLSLCIVLLFRHSLFAYFVQDDFFLLKISQAKNLWEFFSFFIPLREVVWYRPLSSQIFFFLSQFIFGLHPIPYHIVVLITHGMTTFFLFRLVFAQNKNRLIAFIAAGIYATSWIHFLALSWLASYSFVLGPLFLILTLYTYQKDQFAKALLFFLCGLLTSELFIILPVMLGINQFIQNRKFRFMQLIPCIVASIIVYLLRKVVVPTTETTPLYQIYFSLKPLIATTKFYILRTIGIPMVIEQMPSLLKTITIIFGLGFICVLCCGLWNLVRRNLISHFFLQYIVISFCFIVPFIFLTNHVAPYYLSFAFIGIAPITAILLNSFFQVITKCKKSFIAISIVLFLVQQIIAIEWTFQTHWLFKRAELAQQLISQKKYVFTAGSEEYFALGAESANQLFNGLLQRTR